MFVFLKAHLAGFHNEANAVLVIFWRIQHTKSLYRSSWFCRNNHPHGWNDKEKTERNIEFMYITTSLTQQQTRSVCCERKWQEWENGWQSPEEFKQRRTVYHQRTTASGCTRNSAMHIRTEWKDNTPKRLYIWTKCVPKY